MRAAPSSTCRPTGRRCRSAGRVPASCSRSAARSTSTRAGSARDAAPRPCSPGRTSSSCRSGRPWSRRSGCSSGRRSRPTSPPGSRRGGRPGLIAPFTSARYTPAVRDGTARGEVVPATEGDRPDGLHERRDHRRGAGGGRGRVVHVPVRGAIPRPVPGRSKARRARRPDRGADARDPVAVNVQIAEMRAKADAAARWTPARHPRRRQAAPPKPPPSWRPTSRPQRPRSRSPPRTPPRVGPRELAQARGSHSPPVLTRMCDGSLGSTSTSRGASMQESRCENGKSRIPPAKTSNRPAPATGLPTDPPYVRPTVATIDLTAGKGRAGLAVGGQRAHRRQRPLRRRDRRHREARHRGRHPLGDRPHEAGKTRQVRTIDLEPVGANPTPGPAARSRTPADPQPAPWPADRGRTARMSRRVGLRSRAAPPRSARRRRPRAWARSASGPAGGKRYDGPWTWTAAITSPDASAIGAATDEIPASNSSIAHA